MKISQVTLAVTNSKEMVNFYRNVFNAQFNEFDAMGEKMYSGNISGLNLLLCPNTIAGVDAKQSRHQFDYDTEDLDVVVKSALDSGGSVMGDIAENDKQRYATIIDPDGNTMNFYQNKN